VRLHSRPAAARILPEQSFQAAMDLAATRPSFQRRLALILPDLRGEERNASLSAQRCG
jgi:phage tail protein X